MGDLKKESNDDEVSRSAERRRFEEKMRNKKSEMEKQWENFIADYRDIAQYKMANMDIAQIVLFEHDPPFQRLKAADTLSDHKQYRANMVREYMAFYAKQCSLFAHRI